MPWTFNLATDIGTRSEQQDRLDLFHSKDGRRHLIVLADGMGGLQNGAQAAQMLVNVAKQHFFTYQNMTAHLFLQNICLATHRAINDLQQTTESVMGTTAVLLYIDNQRATWTHVGDSRLYHFRNNNLLTCTNDHSLRQLMLTRGADSTTADAMQNQLYMRLGGEQLPEPDFNSANVQADDIFLLCSDGLWQAIQPNEMLKTLEQHTLEQEGEKYLVDLAKQRNGDRCDNISLAIAQWQDSKIKKCWRGLLRILSRH